MLPPLSFALPPAVASAPELMALAHALEEEAARRYGELAARMQRQGEESLAALFGLLSRIEQKHAAEVDRRALAVTGQAAQPMRVSWQLPENFDEEAAQGTALSPYRALAIAARNEERAFAFYVYVAAAAETTKLRELAEQFASDELEHAALLRRERRKAFRQEPRAAPERRPESANDLLAQAAAMEQSAAAAHRALAKHLRAGEQPAVSALFDRAADDEQDLSRSLAARLSLEAVPALRSQSAKTVREGLRLLEDAFDRYSEFVERATDEAVLREAQSLAERALRRLAYVRGALPNS